MANEDKPAEDQVSVPTPEPQPAAESPPALPPPQTDSPSPAPTDRAELLQRARAFLTSPQVRHEDASAKRRFLAEKGLTDTEIEGLLYEVVRRVHRPTLPMSQRSSRSCSHRLLPHFLLGHIPNRRPQKYRISS